ncbi:MAG: ATP-dependent Clp protease proteolytic subunit, partial [Geminicoccaceae bacterium]
LDKMKSGMVGAYRDKSERDDSEIEALMQAETWLTAEEAIDLGLADRIEEPVRMAAQFDLSRFQNPPPQFAAVITQDQETDMPDPEKDRTEETETADEGPEALEASVAEESIAQLIDLDGVRADERQATLAYVREVHELCALAGRDEQAASFIAKAAPVARVRRALLEARAAEDEATAIRGQVRSPVIEPAPASIDTAAIYAARNQNVR